MFRQLACHTNRTAVCGMRCALLCDDVRNKYSDWKGGDGDEDPSRDSVRSVWPSANVGLKERKHSLYGCTVIVMLNCCDGLAGDAPVVAVPFAVTVNVAAPAGVVEGTGGGGGGLGPPPQLVSPDTMKMTTSPTSIPVRRRFRFFPMRNTIPSVKGPNVHSIA